MQFHYTLHFLNRFLNIHSNIHFFLNICTSLHNSFIHFTTLQFITHLTFKENKLYNSCSTYIQYLFINMYNFLHIYIIHFTFKWTNYTIFTQSILHIFTIKFFIFGTNHTHKKITNAKTNNTYSIYIEYFIFLYLHFPHISVKCLTFQFFLTAFILNI